MNKGLRAANNVGVAQPRRGGLGTSQPRAQACQAVEPLKHTQTTNQPGNVDRAELASGPNDRSICGAKLASACSGGARRAHGLSTASARPLRHNGRAQSAEARQKLLRSVPAEPSFSHGKKSRIRGQRRKWGVRRAGRRDRAFFCPVYFPRLRAGPSS
ncbi:hypothetical protein MRX96_016879 [Rhipicephalus microplus]